MESTVLSRCENPFDILPDEMILIIAALLLGADRMMLRACSKRFFCLIKVLTFEEILLEPLEILPFRVPPQRMTLQRSDLYAYIPCFCKDVPEFFKFRAENTVDDQQGTSDDGAPAAPAAPEKITSLRLRAYLWRICDELRAMRAARCVFAAGYEVAHKFQDLVQSDYALCEVFTHMAHAKQLKAEIAMLRGITTEDVADRVIIVMAALRGDSVTECVNRMMDAIVFSDIPFGVDVFMSFYISALKRFDSVHIGIVDVSFWHVLASVFPSPESWRKCHASVPTMIARVHTMAKLYPPPLTDVTFQALVKKNFNLNGVFKFAVATQGELGNK